MGKHEPGTPKYIANKMKAKGLQKLRWFCQMCQKQCRDENGFKCHMTSESHQRQLLLFADNEAKYLGEFSYEFSKGYLELLKRQFGTKRVHANRVYQEYISDRNHLHMNATRWHSLTGFVKWLGRTGKCIVDETEKGWFITYIDRDPETIRRQEQIAKKEKMDKDDAERRMEFLNKQIKRGLESATPKEEKPVEPAEFVRNEDEKITIDLGVFKKPAPVPVDLGTSALASLEKAKRDNKKKKDEKRKSALDEIIEEEEQKKKKVKRKDHWLQEDIVVKVITSTLGEKYHNKKGVVEEVVDKYGATVRMLDTNHKLKLDQAHLETVIPNLGRKVKILNGAYTGLIAELEEINPDEFSATMKIAAGPLRGKVIDNVAYEDISKLHVEQ